ncbi:hypothetical protein JW921_01750 [Candidatus Fermentibacterales bacterium]|nr:hypothetical protein [Candidatus Fermentibacterales bacterium]
MPETIRAGFFQFAPRFGEVEANLVAVLEGLSGAEAGLVVLPELPFTGYCFRDREEVMRYAEDPGSSPTLDALESLCRARELYLVTGFAEREGDRVYNSALLIGPGGIVARYRKIHLFNREKAIFDPGYAPPEVHDVRGVRVGLMVCFDWVFPEVARIMALRGADVLCHPTNLVLDYCQRAMLTRSLENSVYAITANRYGTEDRGDPPALTFTGASQVSAPSGEVLHRAPADGDELFVFELDPAIARDKWMTPGNHLLADRRPHLYGDVVKET